jgi:hypothetical protein
MKITVTGEPLFAFTSDIDWASEDVLRAFFDIVDPFNLDITLFLTHKSKTIESKGYDKGIHPNFLPGSSHGNTFKEVIDTCMGFGPTINCFRSHRAFDVTDTNHMLFEKYGFKYSSNYITNLQPFLIPMRHESGLLNYPVFFEDGTHLYNKMGVDFEKHKEIFSTAGLKIISFHPMNMVLNSPSLDFMRNIKNRLSREEYQHFSDSGIELFKNEGNGIRDFVLEMMEWVKANHQIVSLKQLYDGTN